MDQQFSNTNEQIQNDAELRMLIERLETTTNHHIELLDNKIEHPIITVEDVAEATGFDPKFVEQELRKMHNELREARLVGVLRELEEPLYRVERPSINTDSKSDPIFRLKTVRKLMDRHNEAPVLSRRKISTAKEDAESAKLTRIVLITMAILCFALMVWGIYNFIS